MRLIKYLKWLYWRGYDLYYSMLTLISPRLNTMVLYHRKFHKWPNLTSPSTFNEKMLKLKLENYNHNPLVKQCADKYAVRRYVDGKGLGDILVPLISVYDDPNQIEWNKLPRQFVIKWNFGCHMNIVCKDKCLLDKSLAKKKLRWWKGMKTFLINSELQYKVNDKDKKIIVEQFLDNGKGDSPEDFKVYCYNGVPRYFLVCCNRQEDGRADYFYFDTNWKFMPFDIKNQNLSDGQSIKKPDNLNLMLSYSKTLSEGFPFVRVGFYIVGNKIYFGELTFTPCGCMDQAITDEANIILGQPIIV